MRKIKLVQSGFSQILLIVVLLIGLVAVGYLVQQKTSYKPKADYGGKNLTAVISGSRYVPVGQQISYTIDVADTEGQLSEVNVWAVKSGGGIPADCTNVKYGTCSLGIFPISSSNKSSANITFNYTFKEALMPQDYYMIYVDVWGGGGKQCTGKSGTLPRGWSSCGNNGYLFVRPFSINGVGASVVPSRNNNNISVIAYDSEGQLSEVDMWAINTDGSLVEGCEKVLSGTCSLGTFSVSGYGEEKRLTWYPKKSGTYQIYADVWSNSGQKCSGRRTAGYPPQGWKSCGREGFMVIPITGTEQGPSRK